MKELAVVEVGVPLKNLIRNNRTIRGSHAGSLWEVDTLHCIAYENVLSKDTITIRQLSNVLETGIYVCDHANLHVFGGQRLLAYNETSSLNGQFSGGYKELLFARYHHKHSKYSLNVFDLLTKEQRIAKLFDEQPTGLVYDEPGKSTSAVATYQEQEAVQLLDLQKCKLTKLDRGRLLSDENYLYVIDSKEARAIDRWTHKKQFELELKRRPLRIETFNQDVIVASDSGLEFFDFRKLTRLVSFVPVPRTQDFLHDPNIERIFVSAATELIVFGL